MDNHPTGCRFSRIDMRSDRPLFRSRFLLGVEDVPNEPHQLGWIFIPVLDLPHAEGSPSLFEEVVFRRQAREVGRCHFGGSSHAFGPRKVFGNGSIRVHLDPVALANPAVRKAELELAPDTDQSSSTSGFDDLGYVIDAPRVFLAAK